MPRLHSDAPEPAGFGKCGECAYRFSGPTEVCFRCATSTFEPLAALHDRCEICDGKLGASGRCRNPLCNRDPEERGWDHIWAISMRTGALKQAIHAYKYDGRWGWSYIFGRVLVGYLQGLEDIFRSYDAIIPSPTFTGKGGRGRDHTAEVIERARDEDPSWPFRLDLLEKTKATPRLADYRRFAERAQIVETKVRPALKVVKPRALRGRSVLVFDDVFTGGLTLREISFKLLDSGATDVSGIVLARQPFGG